MIFRKKILMSFPLKVVTHDLRTPCLVFNSFLTIEKSIGLLSTQVQGHPEMLDTFQKMLFQ